MGMPMRLCLLLSMGMCVVCVGVYVDLRECGYVLVCVYIYIHVYICVSAYACVSVCACVGV